MKKYSHKVDSADTWQIIQNTREIATKRYFAMFGGLYLLLKKTTDGHDRTKDASALDLHTHLRKILTTDNRVLSIENLADNDSATVRMTFSRNVRSAAFVDDIPKIPRGELIESRLQYELSRPFLLDLKLQLRTENKKPFWMDSPLFRIPDNCMVWFDGAIFMAFHDSNKSFDAYGHAVRDVLKEIFSASELLDVEILGPSPIHPHVEILFISPDNKQQGGVEISPILKQPTMYDNSIYLPIALPENNMEAISREILYSIFYGFHKILGEFYRALTIRSDALSKHMTLEGNIDVVKESVARLHSVSSWRFLERRKMIRLIEKGISETTLALIDNQSAYGDIAEASEKISKKAIDSNMAACCVDYLVEHCRDLRGVDYILINTLLERLDSEIGRYSTNRTQLMAAVLGGAIGAALTLLITWIVNSL